MTKKEQKKAFIKFCQFDFNSQIAYCKQFNDFIKVGATGTLEDLANKFEIDINLALEILIYMIDELECPISYNSHRKTYYYDGDGELLTGFVPEV
ncbi:hypothetical protein [Pedobacter ginsengisoli]|uniref:hypothetical protein n=1 Tax=Pedobacter ginsengisoli TaxID=363852 RepID=UPI00254A7FB9|nr:hypothetical protein [Pedobacter ginsengisoli]